jgi:hypothetical protein
MPSLHHEVPTHLDVEDKVMLGLTVRQFLQLLVGSSASYTLWQQTAALGDAFRVALVTMSVGMTLALALLHPAGRTLDEWTVAALLFMGSPRRAAWQPPEPTVGDWRPTGANWQELAPDLVWAGEGQA